MKQTSWNGLTKGWVRFLLWSMTAGWGLLIFGFSAQNGSNSSGLSRRVSEWLVGMFTDTSLSMLPMEKQQQIEFVVRKLAHFSEYAVLGVLFALLVIAYQKPGCWYGLAALAGLVYAVTDEWHQSFVPNRAPAVKDVLIDFFGAAAGVVLVMLLAQIISGGSAKSKNLTPSK